MFSRVCRLKDYQSDIFVQAHSTKRHQAKHPRVLERKYEPTPERKVYIVASSSAFVIAANRGG